MIRRPPRSTQSRSSAASDVYKRQPLVDGDRLTKRPGERFIAGLGDVVAILAIERLDMQRQPRMLGKGLEPLAEQLGVHIPDLGAGEGHLPHEKWPPRD